MKTLWGWMHGAIRRARMPLRLWRIWIPFGVALAGGSCRDEGVHSCSDSGALEGCEPLLEDLPPGTLTCDVSPAGGAVVGACVPYVDAGWHTVLARMAFLPKSLLRCPESAPNAGLYGVEIPDGGATARRVIGCSVNPYSSCPSPGLACVPFELDYAACVTQSGPHDCPAEYSVRTSVQEDGPGGEVTICCRPPAEPD